MGLGIALAAFGDLASRGFSPGVFGIAIRFAFGRFPGGLN
jgi:hypothetical protein